jgi:hypothetical protein
MSSRAKSAFKRTTRNTINLGVAFASPKATAYDRAVRARMPMTLQGERVRRDTASSIAMPNPDAETNE